MAHTHAPKEQSPITAFIKKMSSSHFNYWFGYVSNLTLVVWLSLQGFQNGQSVLTWYEWIYIPALGLFVWTFLEYFLHKYAYHVWKSPFEKGHGLHHEAPYDLMGVPWYLTAVVIVLTYYGLSYLVNPAYLGVIMAFVWLGYIGYCIVHHAIHHWNFNSSLFKKLKRHHYLHHAKDDKNIGITTTFWDHVFGSVE